MFAIPAPIPISSSARNRAELFAHGTVIDRRPDAHHRAAEQILVLAERGFDFLPGAALERRRQFPSLALVQRTRRCHLSFGDAKPRVQLLAEGSLNVAQHFRAAMVHNNPYKIPHGWSHVHALRDFFDDAPLGSRIQTRTSKKVPQIIRLEERIDKRCESALDRFAVVLLNRHIGESGRVSSSQRAVQFALPPSSTTNARNRAPSFSGSSSCLSSTSARSTVKRAVRAFNSSRVARSAAAISA